MLTQIKTSILCVLISTKNNQKRDRSMAWPSQQQEQEATEDPNVRGGGKEKSEKPEPTESKGIPPLSQPLESHAQYLAVDGRARPFQPVEPVTISSSLPLTTPTRSFLRLLFPFLKKKMKMDFFWIMIRDDAIMGFVYQLGALE